MNCGRFPMTVRTPSLSSGTDARSGRGPRRRSAPWSDAPAAPARRRTRPRCGELRRPPLNAGARPVTGRAPRQLDLVHRRDRHHLAHGRGDERLLGRAHVVERARALLDRRSSSSSRARVIESRIPSDSGGVCRPPAGDPEERPRRALEHAPVRRDEQRLVVALLLREADGEHVARVGERLEAVEHARRRVGDRRHARGRRPRTGSGSTIAMRRPPRVTTSRSSDSGSPAARAAPRASARTASRSTRSRSPAQVRAEPREVLVPGERARRRRRARPRSRRRRAAGPRRRRGSRASSAGRDRAVHAREPHGRGRLPLVGSCVSWSPLTTSSSAPTATATSTSSSPSPTARTSSTPCARSPAAASTGTRRSGGRRRPTRPRRTSRACSSAIPSLLVADEVDAWLAEAVTGWVGRVGAARLDGRGAFVLETISGELPDELRRRPGARRRAWVPFSQAAAEALLELRGARLDKRALRCAMRLQVGQEPAPAHALAGRQRRRAALHARRQLGPGHDPGLPRAARLRGARPLAPARPVPDRAARALPAHLRRRGRRRARSDVLDRLRAEHDAAIGDVRRSRAHDAPPVAGEERARRRAAPVPARRRRLRAARAADVPRRRAGPRQDRAGARRARGGRRLARRRHLPREPQAQLAARDASAGSRTARSPSSRAPARSRRPPTSRSSTTTSSTRTARGSRCASRRRSCSTSRTTSRTRAPSARRPCGGSRTSLAARRAAARAHRHAGDEPRRGADRPAAHHRPARGLRLGRALRPPLPGHRRGGADPLAPAAQLLRPPREGRRAAPAARQAPGRGAGRARQRARVPARRGGRDRLAARAAARPARARPQGRRGAARRAARAAQRAAPARLARQGRRRAGVDRGLPRLRRAARRLRRPPRDAGPARRALPRRAAPARPRLDQRARGGRPGVPGRRVAAARLRDARRRPGHHAHPRLERRLPRPRVDARRCTTRPRTAATGSASTTR